MKKRIISMLLTVLMVMSLFSGLPLNAYAATTAGANTIEYTMGAGDYVLRICQKFGLNYYTCKDAIMILNNIYDGQWNKLAVGRTLILPASDNDAVLIANGARLTNVNSGAASTTISTGTAATYNTGTATTGTSVATTATFKSADSLAYYLVPYTMSAGENVSGVCNSLGVNFNIFSPFIKQVNGISDWTKVRAGQTLIIPTPVCPSVGTTCYGVMQHKVAGSDTAYGIASSNGVNYNASKTLLEVLNQTNNLANLTAGQWFYYPVPLTVSVPGTGNPGSTATTTTTTTVTDGNGTTTTTSTTTSKLYKLTSGMSASDGTMLFYVNSQAVTAAPAGAKVTIVTDTASGKAIQSLTVKHSDGKADLHLSADTFIMPSCDVRVDCEIKTGHDININANYSNKASATLNGVSVQAAVKGATIVIKSTDPNYEIQSISAYYRKTVAASTKTALTVSSSKAFIMPDADVDVEITLKPVSTYAFYVNDPMNGTFYLEVNGSPVTRAAKGAQVTVVTKADSGYEPKSLVVKNHTTGEKINVFSNTFTMPAFDVDVEVKFVGKGNNILIMPSQFGNVFAFDSTSVTKVSQAVTEAETNTIVYLAAINDEVDPPVGLLDTAYNISYDVVRNSDGLKVKVEDVSGTWDVAYDLYGTSSPSTSSTAKSFKMPKGGVTVTPIITKKATHNIWSEIYLNNVEIPANTYKDCSFSVTWNNKTSEFTMTDQSLKTLKQIKSEIPVGEYIDLRYDTNDGVAFVKYRIMNSSTLLEEETNEANLHGYFKMPDMDIRIEAYFETGKVAMGPAAITGIGSVGYKVVDGTGWKSANTCNPGDTVMIVVTAGNGYKFDNAKYESKLIVSRKDNGAPLTLTPVYPAPSTLDPNSYAFTFTMPASGVDVQAIFDPKPFIITMKCVDETGNDLTGLGLWQIAIDWVPGVLDNATNITWTGLETQFEVAYGDYVTVAMTEAGWSKYDMVSFRIDGLEYTADQLNYFYNFQMIDDRAKDLTITAVLRPKNVGIHTMSAIYDTTKLGVEFLIIDSPTGYSDEYRFNNSGALNYLNKAVTGDKVAIVANAIDSKYSVTAKDISITPFGTDADKVIPTEEWIYPNGIPAIPGAPNAFRVFTFTMPDADVYVQINVSGTQHSLSIGVYDAKDNSAVNGMVRLFATTATGATISRDVGANNSFDDVPYKSVVQILRSELALAEGKVIKDVEIKTLSGKSINYTDMTTAGEGIYFTMPDEAVWVVIRMDDRYFNIPTVVVNTQVKHGTLYYRTGPDETYPVRELKDFKPGETVYVFDEPNIGYAHLGLGDLKIYVNGMNNAVNVQKIITTPGSPEHVWSFTMPEGTIIMKAEFQKEEAQEITITVNATGAPTSEIDVTVGGYTTTITVTGTVKAYEGQSVTITSATDGYEVNTVVSGSTKGVTGNVYVVPDAEDLGGTTDTLTVTLTPEGYPIKWSTNDGGYLEISDGTKEIVSANAGDTIHVYAHPDTNYHVKDSVITLVSLDDGSQVVLTETLPDYWTFPMPAGGVGITATFAANNKVLVTFDASSSPASSIATISMSGGETTVDPSTSRTFELEVGTVITVTGDDNFNKVALSSASGQGVNGNKFTVNATDTNGNPNDLEDTLYITLSGSAKAVTVKQKTDSKYGTIGLSDATESPAVAYPESAFSELDDIFFFVATCANGWELDTSKTKVIVNVNQSEPGFTYNSTTQCYSINGISGSSGTGIPYGGITIEAYFKLKTVNLAFASTSGHHGQIKVSGGGNEYIIDTSATPPALPFTFGDKITLTPVNGSSWGTVTVSDGSTVTTSGNTKQFTIDSTGTITLDFDMS